MTTTLEEKLSKIDVFSQVKLSVLGDVFQLEGSERYLKDKKKVFEVGRSHYSNHSRQFSIRLVF